jgi:hypothetical protein
MTKLFTLLFVISVGLCFAGFSSTAQTKTVSIRVSAGSQDRSDTIVSFDLPAEIPDLAYHLRDSRGQIVPLQIDDNRRATFILRSLKAGESKSYTLVKTKSRIDNEALSVHLDEYSDGIGVTLQGRKVLKFVSKPSSLSDPKIKPVFLRGGYIHPVYSPSGRMVTDDYPSDHYHHHGIWFAWTKTEFEGKHPDFWNVGDGTGRIDSGGHKISRIRGDVYGAFKSEQFYLALTNSEPKLALTEHWEVRVYNVGQMAKSRYFVFDIVATQETGTMGSLKLEEYRYGGMGLRGHRDWKDKTKVRFLTSEGKTRADGNATRGRWFVMSGPVDGASVNIAVLDHPKNFRSPQPMRLNPDDPFFNYAPSQLGPFEIKSGEPFVLRYRYVVSDGEPKPDELNRLWYDYANEPKVTVSVK